MDIGDGRAVHFQPESAAIATNIEGADGRKRRKISHLETIPLLTIPTDEQLVDAQSHDGFDQGFSDGAHEWDHLRHWEEQGNDEIEDVDDLGDDVEDEEGFIEIGEDEGEEFDITTQEASAQTGKLSREEITDIINERIEFYALQWHPGKGVDQIPDPEILWDQAEATGRRQQLIKANSTNIEFFKNRLDRLGDEILRSPWNTAEQVRRVCSNLETTVDLLEEAEWLLSIYKIPPEDESAADEQDVRYGEDLVGLHSSHPIEIIDLELGSDTSDSRGHAKEKSIDNEGTLEDAGPITDDGNTAILRDITTLESLTVSDRVGVASQPTQQPTTPQESIQSAVPLGSRPDQASIHTVSRWSWNELVAKLDRKRIIMKLIHEMDAQDRETIRKRVNSVRKQNLLTEIYACIRMFLKKETKMPGILPKDLAKIVTFTKLFLSWWLADNCFRVEVTEWRLEELLDSLDAGCPDLEIFYDWVCHVLSNTFSEEALKRPYAPSQAEIIVISDGEDDM